MGDFDFRDIVRPDRRNKQGSSLNMSEGAMLIEIISDHDLAQVVHFPHKRTKHIGFDSRTIC